MDGGSHASSKIGWARVNVTELFGQLEVLAGFSLDGVLYSLNTSVKILKIYVIESVTKLHVNSFRNTLYYIKMYLANLSNTPRTSPPFCMEMILS